MKTKSEIFKAAHKLAKTFKGHYKACFVLALSEIRNLKSNNNMDLSNYIISNMNSSSDWNEKFYQKNNGSVDVYLNNTKHDVTELWNAELNSKGFFVRSEFDAKFNPLLEKMIDSELDSF